MFKGRKVSNPVVHGATAGAGRYTGDKDLGHVWNSVGKARAELRKIEHRLGDVETRPIPCLNETGETSITEYSPAMDNNQTYSLPTEFPSGAVVDKYGRSAYMRNKAHNSGTSRKVSRMDDKYTEELDTRGRSMGPQHEVLDHRGDRRPVENAGKEQGMNSNRNKDRHGRGSDRAVVTSPKRVDFHERLDLREINSDGTFTDLAVGGVNSLGQGQFRPNSPGSTINTTDSVALRETEIRFLNDTRHAAAQRPDGDVRWNSNVLPSSGNKLTHVNVMVPGSARQGPLGKVIGPTHYTKSTPSQNSGSREWDGASSDIDRRWEVGSSDSGQSDDRLVNRRFKASIRDIDKDGLAKLKEKIRKQQEKSSQSPSESHDHMDVMGASEGAASLDNAPRHNLHTDFEAVEPRLFDLPPPDGATSKQPKVRKVAAGPALPSYKGFSETEVRFKHVEAKPTKLHDIRKKDKRKKYPLNLQDKKHDPPDNRREDPSKGTEKPKRATRVVAPSKPKPSKPEKKDIITTSSWRAGQELVLRELGPVKLRRTSQTSDTQGDRGSNPPDGTADDKASHHLIDSLPEPNNEHVSATAAELEKARNLSEEARRVLNDLNFTGSDEDDWRKPRDESRHGDHKKTLKRKAPKMSAEGEKQISSAKHRHYDSEEIRRYMQKQKASRLKQQREDERRQKEADEIKRKQLEELYNKQKQTASAAAVTTTQNKKVKDTFSKGKHRSDDLGTYHSATSYADLPRHHPFHEDRQRMLVSSESEKENLEHGIIGPVPTHREAEDIDMSDGSSTITGDSMEEATPTTTPRVDSEVKDKAKMKIRRQERDESRNFAVDSNLRSVGGFNFNVDNVLSQFSQALHSKGGELNMPNSGYRSVNSNIGQGHVGNPASLEGNSDQARSRADRVQAIKATADSLKNRIQAEARKITGQDIEGGTTSNPNSRWALPQPNHSEDTFMSRYEKMIGADNDFTVFSSNLPGLRDRPTDHPDDAENPMEAAAIRIQAAYRGHTVRQSLNWKLPSGQSILASHRNDADRDEDESSITETSTFSDITITEDSENSMASPPRKIGAGLRERDFHAGGSRRSRPSDDLHIPRPSGQSKDSKYSWEEPSDPYSVLNVYARQHRNQAKQRTGESSRPKNSSTPVKEDSIRSDHRSSQQATPKPAPRPEVRSRSPGVGRHSDSPVGGGYRTTGFASITDALHNERSRSEATQPKGLSVTFQPERNDSDEDTLEEESYSHSRESEDDKKRKPYTREKRPVKPYPAASKPMTASKTATSKASNRSDSDVSLDSAKDQSLSISLRDPSQAESEGQTTLKELPRYSPSTLERQFYAELNQLESMEESMRQITSMEKTRAISMAQQETMSLAQMLKARQQAHEREMKVLELKAQKEAKDATQQLEGARKRAANASQAASESVARLRKQPTDEEETPLKSIISQNEGRSLLESDNIRPRKSVKVSYSLGEETKKKSSELTRRSDPSYSRSSSRSSHISSDIRTAQDSQDSDSTIRSVSGAEGREESKSESIQEDISQVSGDEYSVIFDETMTEDEMEERSFKAILPSESHRKRAKKQMSDSMSVTSDDGSVTAPPTHRMSLDDLSSFFTGEESFNKFTEEMVKQFMREEEMRSHHQNSLLRLREKALMEKTKAELAWLDQQKHRIRNKGADDSYPQIIKKQRGLKMRLQEQQAEIKRLQEANKAASRERQLILQQREEINRMRQSTQQTKEKVKGRGRLGRPTEVHTEDEVSAFDEHRDVNEKKQKKDYKSDSEIYTEPKSSNRASRHDGNNIEKIKKIQFDEKFLTVREQKLYDRRKNAEELLRWKKRLDEEEAKIFQLEQKALKVWEQKGGQPESTKKRADKDTAVKQVVNDRESTAPKSVARKDAKESQTASTVQESSAISDNVITAKDDSVRRSITETPRTEIASGSESSPEELRLRGNAKEPAGLGVGLSGSESSIPEEVASVSSSVDEASPNIRKSRASAADDTIINDSLYGNDSFEETTSRQAASKKSTKSPRSPFDRFNRKGLQWLAGRDIRSPKSFNKGRSSESESEESISHTDVSYTETQSDFSDYEGRVRALNEELKRRKIEADRLKKERKKRKKEILKSKEEALKKQIEAYDNQIVQLKAELQKEMEHEPVKAGSVKPQIKQPKVSPTKNKVKADATPPRSTNSSICEEAKTDSSAQSSPSVIEDRDQKQVSPAVTKSLPTPKSISQSLEKISEDSESNTLTRSRSDRQRLSPLQQPGSRETSYREDKSDRTEEIEEDISLAGTVSTRSDIRSKVSPRIPTAVPTQEAHPDSQADDYSYTDDFTDDLHTASVIGKNLVSSQNLPSEHSQAKVQERSVRTTTDQISEHISEALSEQSDSEQFEHQLEIQKTIEVKHLEEESDVEPKSPRSMRTDSRPSSEKSERSLSSHVEEEESLIDDEESEPTPSLPASLPPSLDKRAYSDEEAEVISETVLKSEAVKHPALVNANTSDIDQLIDFKDDFDEEITPIPSPPGEEEDNFSVDPMADFSIGDRVLVSGPKSSKKPGTLLYKGKVSFAPGIWAGVELDVAEGNNDGSHEGRRYFTCRHGHGMLVTGDMLMPEPVIRSPRRSVSQESFASSKSMDSRDDESATDQEDSDLSKFISEADKNVQGFDESPEKSTKQHKADIIADQILLDVVNSDMRAINKVMDRKSPPPVARKPQRNQVNGGDMVMSNGIDADQDIKQNDKRNAMTNNFTKNLLDDAITDMITIRNKQRSRHSPQDLITFEQNTEPSLNFEQSFYDEEEDKQTAIPPRPVSPLPGGNVQNSKELDQLNQDIDGLFDEQGEFIDDQLLPASPLNHKPPPPYPGTPQDENSRMKFDQLQEELFSAVPHERSEIEQLVSNAVDVFWNQRRYGESLDITEPPESYFTAEDNNNDMDGKSSRVYKKLLFDLTRDIIKEIYRDDGKGDNPPWQKVKRRQQKYFRGIAAPTTVDILKPIVQQAVIDLLGLNGSRKSDKTQWSIRKKKDHVDNILVQELREEEPDWVNYDDDEMAVKMQLTEAIFETLLTDTMQTMNKIFRKKQLFSQK